MRCCVCRVASFVCVLDLDLDLGVDLGLDLVLGVAGSGDPTTVADQAVAGRLCGAGKGRVRTTNAAAGIGDNPPRYSSYIPLSLFIHTSPFVTLHA